MKVSATITVTIDVFELKLRLMQAQEVLTLATRPIATWPKDLYHRCITLASGLDHNLGVVCSIDKSVQFIPLQMDRLAVFLCERKAKCSELADKEVQQLQAKLGALVKYQAAVDGIIYAGKTDHELPHTPEPVSDSEASMKMARMPQQLEID